MDQHYFYLHDLSLVQSQILHIQHDLVLPKASNCLDGLLIKDRDDD